MNKRLHFISIATQKLINHSPDLKQLKDEGYSIEVKHGVFLLVHDIPYVNAEREIRFGTLVSNLNLAGDVTIKPDTHVIYFIGQQLKNQKFAIIGLGGTGAYILDFVAKTPVAEIHLYDGDVFLQNNAFRAPGAASIAQLWKRSSKADYLLGIYQIMRKNIFVTSLSTYFYNYYAK